MEVGFLKMRPVLLILGGFALLSSIDVVVPAKILFLYPIPYPSHYRAFSPLIEELAARGHQITAYTGFKRQRTTENYTEISITVEERSFKVKGWETVSWRDRSAIALIHGIWNFFPPLVGAALQSKELQTLMHSQEEFDLIIVESTFMEESLLAFSHKFRAPVVNLNPFFLSTLQALMMGAPHSISYIPNVWLSHTDRMTFWQKTKNLMVGVYELVMGNVYYLPMQERMMRKNFNYSGSETLPPLRELIANISLHLVLAHPMMNVRPYSPNVIDVAGMNIKPAGKLPQDLQKFMDEATEGVIYIGFGSYIDAHSFSKGARDIFAKTMRSLKQKIIWKWSEDIADAPNILTKPWLPQQEILAHPNCKLFITHGGFNSLMEAIKNGVPVVGIPFFGDQYYNVAYYESQGVGLEVDLETITVQKFIKTIEKIILTPSFAENAKRLATIFRDQPQTSLEKAVYWVEYVIRHKGAHHLKPASVKMPYYQYLLLDVIAFLTLTLFLVIYILYIFIRRVTQCLIGTKHVSEAKKRR